MTFFVRYLKDSSGNNFLGIDIPESLIKLQLQQLKEYIGDLDFELYTQNHLKSHASKYYLSVITHTEYMQLLEELEMDEFINSLDENVLKFEIEDLKMLGLGTAASGQNRCFFIVCKSDSLQAVRERYNLEKKDLHITLGFDKHNVQGVRKNEIIKKGNKFLKLLALEFYKTETWDFIKSIGNYELDRNSEIIPISLDDSKLKVKIDGYYLQIIYLEDGEKFWIGSKATVDERLPRLAQTEIYKIFNKNTTYGTL